MLGRVENSDQYEDMTGTLQIRAVAKEGEFFDVYYFCKLAILYFLFYFAITV